MQAYINEMKKYRNTIKAQLLAKDAAASKLMHSFYSMSHNHNTNTEQVFKQRFDSWKRSNNIE